MVSTPYFEMTNQTVWRTRQQSRPPCRPPANINHDKDEHNHHNDDIAVAMAIARWCIRAATENGVSGLCSPGTTRKDSICILMIIARLFSPVITNPNPTYPLIGRGGGRIVSVQ